MVAAWLLSVWVGNAGFQIFISGEAVNQLVGTADWLFVMSDVITTMASILIFVLVRQITSNQEKSTTVYRTHANG